jgi:putative ABC transport system substrate-binding protein
VVDRRTFIGGVAGGLLVVPRVVPAQQPAIPVIGFLNSRAIGDDPHLLAAFRQGLKEVGYVEGTTLRSNTASPRVRTIVCPRWPPTWFAVRWR